MATFVSDAMTGYNWQWLANRAGLAGATWTAHPAMASSNGRFYIYANRAHNGSAAAGGASYYALYTASGVPASADYAVECDLVLISNTPSLNIGPCIRVDPAADTYYATFYQDGQLVLMKRVAGVNTTIGTWVSALTYGGTVYRVRLEAVGTAITVDMDGVERISVVDSSIAAAGRVGVRAASVANQDEGVQIDNLTAEDASAPVVGRTQAIFVGL